MQPPLEPKSVFRIKKWRNSSTFYFDVAPMKPNSDFRIKKVALNILLYQTNLSCTPPPSILFQSKSKSELLFV